MAKKPAEKHVNSLKNRLPPAFFPLTFTP